MTLELKLSDMEGISTVEQIHILLEPAKNCIAEGGVVTVTKNDRLIGSARSYDALFKLVLR